MTSTTILGVIFFLAMSTVYERLVLFCDQNQKPMPLQKQKVMIGRKIAHEFRKTLPTGDPKFCISIENDGKYKVIQYPDSFTPEIDTLLPRLYTELTRPKKRKRIQLPAASSRNISSSYAYKK